MRLVGRGCARRSKRTFVERASRSEGTEAAFNSLGLRRKRSRGDRRSPLAYTAHVADSQRFLLEGPAVIRNKRSRRAKSGGLQFRQELPAVLASTRVVLALSYPTRRFVMHNRVDIDSKHSRAIVQEIGERLRALMKEESEWPASLRAQIDRLRESKEQSASIIPTAERWDKSRR
jgi:hypothetical protein